MHSVYLNQAVLNSNTFIITTSIEAGMIVTEGNKTTLQQMTVRTGTLVQLIEGVTTDNNVKVGILTGRFKGRIVFFDQIKLIAYGERCLIGLVNETLPVTLTDVQGVKHQTTVGRHSKVAVLSEDGYEISLFAYSHNNLKAVTMTREHYVESVVTYNPVFLPTLL